MDAAVIYVIFFQFYHLLSQLGFWRILLWILTQNMVTKDLILVLKYGLLVTLSVLLLA